MTRPSFDQAHATFERFLNTPFVSGSLPGVSENGTPDPRLDRTDSMARTQSGPGAHLGGYKPIFGEETPAQSGPQAKISMDRRNSSIRRSLDVSPGKFPL